MRKRLAIGLLILLLAVSAVLMSGCGAHKVIYNGNGNTGGSVPVDTTMYRAGQTVTVLDNTGGLAKTGHVFAGWNTAPDGSGATYTQGQTLTMGTSDITLYAKWAYRVGYIYKPADADDAAAATSFETLLDPIYPTDKIDMANLATTDLTQYAALIIGRNTFLFTDAQVNLIKDSGLPVIGISRGGTSYFGKIGLSMNGGNVASASITGAVVVNNALTIWNRPNALGVNNGDTVAIFTSSSSANVLYSGYLSTGTLHVARCPGNLSYDAIAIETNNLYWAYYNDASTFTETGRKLFINAIHHMVYD